MRLTAVLFTTTFGSLTREYSSLPSVRRRFDFPRADEGGIILGMSENCRTQKQYDYRLRRLIQTTGDLDLAVRHGVPRSTARGWLKQIRTDVVSIDVLDMDAEALQREVLFLRRRLTRLPDLRVYRVLPYRTSAPGSGQRSAQRRLAGT